MNELRTHQMSLIQAYGRYAPEFHIVGELNGDPVVRLRDYPVIRVGNEVKPVFRERIFTIDWAGKCGQELENGDWEPLTISSLPRSQQAFINDYTESLITTNNLRLTFEEL